MEPEGPLTVTDVFKERCHLLWEPPTDDGGLGIDYYLVEMQDTDGRKWTEVGRIQGDTQCGIPSLEPGKKYKFRVRACNQEGQSEPLATEKEMIAKDPWGQSAGAAQDFVVAIFVVLVSLTYFRFYSSINFFTPFIYLFNFFVAFRLLRKCLLGANRQGSNSEGGGTQRDAVRVPSFSVLLPQNSVPLPELLVPPPQTCVVL